MSSWGCSRGIPVGSGDAMVWRAAIPRTARQGQAAGFSGLENGQLRTQAGHVDVVAAIVVDVGAYLDLGLRRGWKATGSSVIVVDVRFCLVADGDNDIDYDYDGHSRLPSPSATLSDTPIDEELDIDNDDDCDIDLAVRPVHGLNSLLRRTCGAKTGRARRGARAPVSMLTVQPSSPAAQGGRGREQSGSDPRDISCARQRRTP